MTLLVKLTIPELAVVGFEFKPRLKNVVDISKYDSLERCLTLEYNLQECELQPALQEFASCHRPDNHQFNTNVSPFLYPCNSN